MNKFRLLGILPIAFMVIRLFVIWQDNKAFDIFWVCNLSNLALGIGILANQAKIIRPAAFWLLLGLPLWAHYVITTGDYQFTSFLTHIGGNLVGLLALATVRVDKWSWVYAITGFWVLQLFSRLFTPPDLNINVAHNLRFTLGENTSMKYWQFWIASTLVYILWLWLINLLTEKIFPIKSNAGKLVPEASD
jgi:hypothetical protein